MRNLASIQRIKSLDPIENAEAIERATVLGWQLVVKKGEFQVGDRCIYVEIDSILPEKPEFEFLRERKFRIRTIRLRGQISQGICFPLSMLPPGTPVVEGTDLTDLLEITKWEPPMPANLLGIAKGPFPSFIPKTDETRVQNLQELLDKFGGQIFWVAEKLDGSSVTYFWKNGEFGTCSRNLEMLEADDNSSWQFAREKQIEEKLAALGRNLALQGEIIGEGIQKNKYRLRGSKVLFFSVFDIDRFQYLDYQEFKSVVESLGLETVPILETDYRLETDIQALVEKSRGRSVLNKDTHREGIVLRPLKEANDLNGRVSFKAINPDFLLKYQDE